MMHPARQQLRRRPHRDRGLTMIEAVISLVVISVLGVAALRAFSASALTRGLALERARGVALANDLLAEITAAPYGEPPQTKPEEVADRTGFATVGQYNGWESSPPVARDGAPLAPAPWRRFVTVQPVQLDGVTPAAAATGVVRISVRVFKGDRLVASEEALRSAAWDQATRGGS